MSILLDDATPDYYSYVTPYVTAIPLTLFAIYRTDDQSVFPQDIIHIGAGFNYFSLTREKDSGVGTSAIARSAIFTTGRASTGQGSGGWEAACASFTAINYREITHYTVGMGLQSGINTTSVTPTITGSTNIGSNTVARHFSGWIQEIGIWSCAIGHYLARAMCKGYVSPAAVQRKNLVCYIDFITNTRIGNHIDGVSFTATGAPATDDHGPVFYPTNKNFYYKKIPRGLPDSVGRMNRRKLTEGVF